MIVSGSSLMFLRLVMAVRRCSMRWRGSITVVHVARVSAILAPATGCLCQRGAGAAPLSGCVRPAIAREDQLTPTTRVTHNLQPTHFFLSYAGGDRDRLLNSGMWMGEIWMERRTK